MTMQDAVRDALGKYVTFSGRASRPAFWWWVLAALLVNLAAGLIDAALFGAELQDAQPLSLIVSLGLLPPNLAVSARRLHDVGRSGWWLLIGLIPLIGFLVLLYWYVQPSQQGPNQYD